MWQQASSWEQGAFQDDWKNAGWKTAKDSSKFLRAYKVALNNNTMKMTKSEKNFYLIRMRAMYLQPKFYGMLHKVELFQKEWITKQIEGRMNLPSDNPGHLGPMDKNMLELTIEDHLTALEIVETREETESM